MTDTKVGVISHYYDNLSVAVVDLEKTLKVGDKIKFVRHKEDLFQQEVASMQEEHKQVKTAGKGKNVGLKVDQKVKEGVEVYKVG